ncbi:MAG TPA: trypsin-like peptidase domain-containing protein [Rhizomicrobium sp.]|nr:trypsin-like peptidase domain-containing protein [Rhizomicrobium sp.]
MRRASIALALALCGCATSSGEPANGFIDAQIRDAYIPLHRDLVPFGHEVGAAVVIAHEANTTIAVTNAHNYAMIDPSSYFFRFPGKDLIFFYANRGAPAPLAHAYAGERVRAYGQGVDDELRDAEGTVSSVDAKIRPTRECKGCPAQPAIVYDAPAGPGFSGGPVVDAKTGALVGITFAYETDGDKLVMFAYDVNMIVHTLDVMLEPVPPPVTPWKP